MNDGRAIAERDRLRRQRTLTTPEGIVLHFTLAQRSARIGALLIDFLLLGAGMLAVTLALAYVAGGVFNLLGQARSAAPLGRAVQFLFIAWMGMMFVLRNGWFLFFELGPRGATPGKRALGIRIAARPVEGAPAGRLTAEMVLARNLLRDIELFLPISFLLAARNGGDMGTAGLMAAGWFLIIALLPWFNRDALRAGDIVAGTWVVEAPRRQLYAVLTTPPMPAAAPAPYRFSEAELAIYGEYELQTLEALLREGRAAALAAVCARICERIGRDPPEADDRAFLQAYYTQLRARLESGMRLGRRKADKHTAT
ncbi:MAG: RDD family protein [Pseudomonadota bacterium]